jgi:hypothetical protein
MELTMQTHNRTIVGSEKKPHKTQSNMILLVIYRYFKFISDRPPLLLMTKNGISLLDEGTWQEHVLYTQQHENSYFKSSGIHYKKSLLFWTESIWNDDTYRYR